MTVTRTLTVTSGPAAGSVLDVERELIIGRREADLTIADEELSRRHATVRPVETGVVVEDLGSLNGTFVDGVRISGQVTLTADATIRVGVSEMSLKLEIPAVVLEAEAPAEDSGRTRLATAVPQEPSAASSEPRPIPQPQVTRVRAVPGAQAQEPSAASSEPRPIPQPQVTRVRAVPGAQAQEPSAASSEPRPILQPQVTRVRAGLPGGQEPPAGAEPAGSPSGEEHAKPPGIFKRLLGRIRGRGRGDEPS